MTLSRRAFLGLMAVAALPVATGGLWSTQVEPNWVAVERIALRLRRLPARLDGLRIAQLSDLHISPLVSQGDIARAVALTLDQAADLIVLTGDFIWHDASFADQLVAPLRGLTAPLGVYAIFGNHDHWHGAGRVADSLQAAGIDLLENRALRLETGTDPLWLAGVDDIWEERQDLALTLRNVPEDQCTVLLAHEPDFGDEAATYPVDLQLSGHSHGGQIRLPFVGAPVLPYLGRKYPIGLYQVGDMALYTNRGIGLIAPPVRLNCRPEITVLTLRAGG
ncbi:MAG: metallophosphoesterase [Chloroflexota bacterium]|nr:metallophosphoesterase [Chloroflexota bacterium]